MKKNDKTKVDGLIERIITGYSYCFNPEEVSNKYLDMFSNNRYESCVWNNEFVKLRLDILEGIDDTYEGIENKQTDKELRYYFTSQFKTRMKEELLVRLEEIKARRKKEKEESKESKGK